MAVQSRPRAIVGGQFERLIAVMKQSLYKSIGNGNLRWHELEEVILDVEITLNNRPLGYVEDYVQMPVFTHSAMLYGQPNQLPEEEAKAIEDVNLRKRAKYLKWCKDVLWSRWTTEYLKALRERHNLNRKTGEKAVKPGDVILNKGEEGNRGRWRFGIVEQSIQGRDGVVRGAQLRAGKSYLEQPVQHLYALKLFLDRPVEERGVTLSAQAAEFQPRRAAADTRQRIAAIAQEESQEDWTFEIELWTRHWFIFHISSNQL